jgi:hypothetical protein
MANATLQASSNVEAPPALTSRASDLQATTSIDRLKALYNVSHQAEFLSLHAEVDTLVLQLQAAIRNRRP